MERNEVEAIFENQTVVTVEFEKTDGTSRTMQCTTKMESIPEALHPTGESIHKDNDGIFTVFDVEKNDWRCFIIAKVTSLS